MLNIQDHKLWQRFREPISGLTHLAGATLGFVGTIFLLIFSWGDWLTTVAVTIYGISLILMFSASASYHLVKAQPKTLLRLRKFDHAAIYVVIAGSYTPICLLAFKGFWSWGFLSVIWILAVLGVIVKLFIIKAPRWTTAGVYLVMGWLSIFAVNEMIRALSPLALGGLVIGGLFYSFGAVIYILKKPDFFPNIFGFHELWHIFVLLGALSHFVVIWLIVI
jgi:hemolysin III